MKNSWEKIDGISFMKEMLLNTSKYTKGLPTSATLSVEARNTVSGRWWTLTWIGDDGEQYQANSAKLDTLFERAVKAEMEVRQREQEKAKKEAAEAISQFQKECQNEESRTNRG